MTNWIVRGQANLLAASRSRNLIDAQREWRITYAYEDLGTASGTCELCEHPKIRHKFEIENGITRRYLWVGSECIKKFVPVFKAGVEITDEEIKGLIVDQIVSALKTKGRRERAFALLDSLGLSDARLRNADWYDNWQLGYSVKQLQLIAVAAKKASSPFNAADFRINTRRERVMEQLFDLELWQYRQLRGALPASRRKQADLHYGVRTRA
jgi:hypothetical protein